MTAGERLGFHSLTRERATDLPVEGSLPAWLTGVLVRNGPGSFTAGGTDIDHWFDGLAMLHRFGFDGEGVTYRNRFLRTDTFERVWDGEPLTGFATGGASALDLLRALFAPAYDNTNIVAERFGDRYLALTETPRRVEFDPGTLDTLGHVQYDGPEPSGHLSCAHLVRDPWTDRLVTFEVEFGRRCAYHVHETVDATSREHVATVPVEEPAYMHSFALTPNYVVLTEFPFVVDPMDMLRSDGGFVDAFRWEPDRGTRFLVVDRRTGGLVAEPRMEAFFGFHHVNAYERNARPAGEGRPRPGDDLVVDLETVPDAASLAALSLSRLRADDLGVFGGSLDRFTVSLRADGASVDRERLHDGTALPTASPAVRCRPHRYVYAQGTDQPVTEWPGRLVKVDTETREATAFAAEGERHYSEPIFVPAPASDREAEDDGVVLTVELDVGAGHSWLVVLDGRTFEERARAAVPHAIPFDFHGRYFPELD
ncbi:carotenoid oxygenase family protein [Halomarina litorea]|uniref:carotenoid oxygenase family protein n=1 Tax=Halomarina litorea TaxID=2961595 RepID=UPI0020C29500|nr:carotenoid oxygenase family protein [Halomarina sp. BCD28]